MEKYLSTRTIARSLGVTPTTVRRWVEKRILPAYKVGKEIRVFENDFNEFMRIRKIK